LGGGPVSGALITLYSGSLLLLLAFSAFFSSAETALFSLTRAEVRRMGRGTRGERAVGRLLADPSRLLSTIVVGNLFVNVLIASLVAALSRRLFGQGGLGVAICSSTVLLLVFGEVTPKTIAVYHAHTLASVAAVPLVYLGVFFAPVRFLLRQAVNAVLGLLGQERMRGWQMLTEEEIRATLALGEAEGVTTSRERELLDNIVGLGSIEANEIMVPRTEIHAISDSLTLAEAFAVARSVRHSRLPIYSGDLDDCWGVFAIVDMPHRRQSGLLNTPLATLRERVEVAPGAAEPPVYPLHVFPESARLEGLLGDMRARRASMVLLVDEYGGTAGLLTLDDILAEILGQLSPGDEPQVSVVGPGKAAVVGGRAQIRSVNQALGTVFPMAGSATIGGYVMELLGRLPRVGDTATDEWARFEVVKMAGRRIDVLRVELPGEGP